MKKGAAMNFINKLERKFGKYAVHNLMYYIIILYGIGVAVNLLAPEVYVKYLSLNAEAILHGQVWRIVTFLVQPPEGSYIFVIFALYLYYMIGTQLERQWGAFRFNLYFFTGVLMHVVTSIILFLATGYNFSFDTAYLNLSLFFAFAAVYPDIQFLLFFVIPVKVKYLAWLNGAFFVFEILTGIYASVQNQNPLYLITPVSAVLSILNFLIFFYATRKQAKVFSAANRRRQHAYRQQTVKHAGVTKHKCAICGRTENDGDHLEFRFCSKCDGNYEYCQDHLFTHTHIKK